MIEFFQFIFSSFWIWLGFVILIYIGVLGTAAIVSSTIAAIRGDDVHISLFSGNEVTTAKDRQEDDNNDT